MNQSVVEETDRLAGLSCMVFEMQSVRISVDSSPREMRKISIDRESRDQFNGET